MRIEKIKNNDELTVKLMGRLTPGEALILEDELLNKLSGVKKLILDLENFDDDISNEGAIVLFKIKGIMRNQGTMEVKNVNESIRVLFEIN
ncbi:MAG: hypothetical protein LBM26_02745 [Methanobrevibacter sp.]|jgi:ABC-type transporter Mla MlaB component|nr:hypothetical protein [Methanobrevibacter sp.]